MINLFRFKFYEQDEDTIDDFFDRLLCISVTVLDGYDLEHSIDEKGRNISIVTVYFNNQPECTEFKTDIKVQKLYRRYSWGDVSLLQNRLTGPQISSKKNK